VTLAQPPVPRGALVDRRSEQRIRPGATTLLSCFVQFMRSLNLNYNLVGAKGARSLGVALADSRTLKELSLDGNHIGDAGAIGLADGLFRNTSLTRISLANNNIGGPGTMAIAEALRESPRVVVSTLRLDGNAFGSAGVDGLSKLVCVGKVLTTLQLRDCQISLQDLPMLARALTETTSLTTIDLSYNAIDAHGARVLAEALPRVTALRHMDLAHNRLGNAGAAALATNDGEGGLAENTSLRMLSLANNGIEFVAADRTSVISRLPEALCANVTLQELRLQGSIFDVVGASKLAAALKVNRLLKKVDVRTRRPVPEVVELWKAMPGTVRKDLEVVYVGSPVDLRRD